MAIAVDQQLHSAGWSSLVARRAHNPKVVGSNPAPATKFFTGQAIASGLFVFSLVAPNLCLNSVRMYSKP